jgi:hypothetical protein
MKDYTFKIHILAGTLREVCSTLSTMTVATMASSTAATMAASTTPAPTPKVGLLGRQLPLLN